MDISAISSAYTSLTAMKDIGKYLLEAKIDKEAEKKVSEAFEKIGTVQDTLFFIREELLRLQEENRVLKEQNRILEDNLSTRQGLIYEKPSYWQEKDGVKDGPFCQKCYDAEQKLIRLQDANNDTWHCRACKSAYFGSGYTPPQRIRKVFV